MPGGMMSNPKTIRSMTWLALTLTLTAIVAGVGGAADRVGNEAGRTPHADYKWFKGNTHTHTLWSDGDAAPEMVTEWYRDHDYNFLVLSDHNILSEGEMWYPIAEDGKGRLTDERIGRIRRRFGEDWVVERSVDSKRQMRLKTLRELRAHFETPGSFLFIQGEEISDGYGGKPVHVNGLNLAEVVPPQKGTSVRDTMQRNIDAVIEQGRRLGRPTLAHVNHPNFGWAMTLTDLAYIRGECFFEVYNGHPSVRNYGGEERPGMESMWDYALTIRLAALDLDVLWALATDDAHNYHQTAVARANPGRGWIVVRAEDLSADAIIEAMHRGDFYASTGVIISDFRHDDSRYVVEIESKEGVEFTTQFIGTRMTAGGPGNVGEILAETTENPAVYEFAGDELYVRAKVVSSELHPNPHREGDHQCAWLQPVKVKGRGK
ncbi:MAG: hypothetical protein JSV91_05780 [Phycisphaerales bacterium]|nr:MAG: hypothetical protein JSV91_05780 [Phycisphaerales bacterium]